MEMTEHEVDREYSNKSYGVIERPVDIIDSMISDAIIKYPEALVVLVDPDGVTHVLDE